MPTGKWTFKGTMKSADGQPVPGTLRIRPNTMLKGDNEELVVTGGNVEIDTGEDGTFSVDLYARDDLDPEGWVYNVFMFPSDSGRWSFSMEPGEVGQVIDLSDVVQVTPVDPQTSYLTPADIGVEGGPAGPLTGGKVPESQISGLLDADDVGADPEGTAAAALVAHTGLADPHPGYLTPAEASAVYDTIGAGAAAVAAHTAASDPHGDRAYAGATFQPRNWGTLPPLDAANHLWQLTFSSTPDVEDGNLWEVKVTHSDLVTRTSMWANERGYYRAEQITGSTWDALITLIAANTGTGNLINLQKRDGSNVRVDVGGFDANARLITSLGAWTPITAIDPNATGRYSISSAGGVSVLGVRFDSNDVVRMRGRIAVDATGSTTGQRVMTIPAGFRPVAPRLLPNATSQGTAAPCEVMTDGSVFIRRTQVGPYTLSFDDLTYSIT